MLRILIQLFLSLVKQCVFNPTAFCSSSGLPVFPIAQLLHDKRRRIVFPSIDTLQTSFQQWQHFLLVLYSSRSNVVQCCVLSFSALHPLKAHPLNVILITLYSVPQQHFTNVNEGYFSVLKQHLRKLPRLKYIEKAVDTIPTQYYINLLNTAYNREGLYKKQRQTRKRKQKKYLD